MGAIASGGVMVTNDDVLRAEHVNPCDLQRVTHGSSSERTSLPSNAFAAPAPRRSATSPISSQVPRAPCPTRIATLRPVLRVSAARWIARSSGAGVVTSNPILDGTILNAWEGGE